MIQHSMQFHGVTVCRRQRLEQLLWAKQMITRGGAETSRVDLLLDLPYTVSKL